MEFAGMEIINEIDELTKTPTGRVQKENMDFLKLFNSKCAICMGDQVADDYVYLYDNYLNFPFTVHQSCFQGGESHSVSLTSHRGIKFFKKNERIHAPSEISGAPDFINFVFEIVHPVTQKPIIAQRNMRCNSFLDLKDQRLIFNKDLYAYCVVPIYMCLIRFSWNLNSAESGSYAHTVSGFLNFNDLLKQNEKNVTLSLDENDKLLLQFNFNFSVVEEEGDKAKLFAMKNLTLNFQLKRAFFAPQPYAQFQNPHAAGGFDMSGYFDPHGYSRGYYGPPP